MLRQLCIGLLLVVVAASAETKPNVILILMDDMGWRDLGYVGNRYIDTPNIDRLAKQGVELRQCYASAPNCAPSRACLLTGQYTPRHGVFTVVDNRYTPGQPHMKVMAVNSRDELPPQTKTLADCLRSNGYATTLIGMWNLGRGKGGSTGSPTGRGFDSYKKPDDVGFEKDTYQDQQGRYLSDVLTDEAVRFIEKNKDQPFFLYFADHSVHEPFQSKANLVEKYQARKPQGDDRGITPEYAAAVEAVDQNIGRILQSLDKLGLTKNTLIMFTSDNGGLPYVIGPLKGSKGLLYEGGIRVPGFVVWPGTIPAGNVYEKPVLGIDFMPTILEATNTPLPTGQVVDGVSLMKPLRTGVMLNRDAVFWHFPCYIGKGEPMSLVRAGDYKLILKYAGPAYELYNLKNDPSESRELSKTEPAKLEELKKLLHTWLQETHAPLADQLNPAYNSTAKESKGGGRAGKLR